MDLLNARSTSLSSRSNPLTLGVEEQLNKVKASQAISPSTSLAALRELYNQVDDLIHLPLPNEDNSINEIVDGSVVVLDVCETTRDVLSQMKQNVQDLQSSLRRKRSDGSSLADDVAAYRSSKKKVIRKCSVVMKKIQKARSHSSFVGKDQQFVHIVDLVREVEDITLSVFESVLSFVAGPKAQSKSMLSKLMHPKGVECKVEDKTELAMLESSIQEIEEGMDGLFRCLIKTRVSLLNSLNQ